MTASLSFDRPSGIPSPSPSPFPRLRRNVAALRQAALVRLRLLYALGVDQVWFALAVALGLLLAAVLMGSIAPSPVPTPAPPPVDLPLIL